MKASSTGLKPPAILLLVALGGAIIIMSAGCLSPTAENTGTGTPVKIGDILKDPASYKGTSVVVTGKVVNQCPSGCWFFVDDGTGSLYVDLLPGNFVIPPMVGSRVTVEGTIQVEGKDVTLVGTKVITDQGVFP
jgi:uncharacterized protein YdeI (BOF family)